jgi:hypothetical protein
MTQSVRRTLAVAAALLTMGVCPMPRSEAEASPTGSIWIRREPTLPISDGLACPPMPRGLYFFRIDDRPLVEVRADRGTLVSGLDPTRSHLVRLYARGQRIAALRVRLQAASGTYRRCVGLELRGDRVLRLSYARSPSYIASISRA